MSPCTPVILIVSMMTTVTFSQEDSINTLDSSLELELDIRDKIVMDLGMKHRPDIEHVSKTKKIRDILTILTVYCWIGHNLDWI